MKHILSTLTLIALMMLAVLSAKYALLYGQVPMFLVVVDLITSFMFAIPITVVSILLARFDVWNTTVNSIISALIFFAATIGYTVFSANRMGLTQKIGGKHVFDDGYITQYGLLVFIIINSALALVLWFALYRNHRFYQNKAL